MYDLVIAFFRLKMGSSIGMIVEKEEETTDDMIIDAFSYGWFLEKGELHYRLVPPTKFECIRWAAIWTPVNFRGLDLFIPNWIENPSIRRCGTW